MYDVFFKTLVGLTLQEARERCKDAGLDVQVRWSGSQRLKVHPLLSRNKVIMDIGPSGLVKKAFWDV